MSNPFIRNNTEYVRDLDLLGNAIKDAAHFLHVSTGDPIEKCEAFVRKETSPEGRFPLKSKGVKCTLRQANGDRIKHAMKFDDLIRYVEKGNNVFTPNMVVYDNPTVNRSFLAKFIDDKMAMRSVVKKRGQKAKMEGNKQLATFCDNQQTTIKTLINSLSGAHASPHNPHYNKTAHSTLTSSTRIATSYANASSERLLAGNRHYWNAEVTLNNIISVTRNTDYSELTRIIEKYNLHIPTQLDVLQLIDRSIEMYWYDNNSYAGIKQFVYSLNDYQRAAFVYTGDLHHLAKFNDSLVREIFTEIVTRPTFKVEDPDSIVAGCNGDVVALCGILCSDILAGMQVSKLKETNYDNYLIYAATVANVNLIFDKYGDLIKCLLVTDNMPPSIYHFPASIRRCVVGSDTDSCMFTCQDWVEWYQGKLTLDLPAQRISATAMYFNTQVIAHMLALFSRHLGVEEKNLFRLQMKNEYSFLVYIVANRAKHYLTLINAKEGNIYKVPELDIKGVGLKDSKVPPKIMKTLELLIIKTMNDIVDGKGVNIYPILQRISNLENEIMTSLLSGKTEYLSRASIKVEKAYKNPKISAYVHYDLWKNVFAEKYGECSPPPYAAVKVSNRMDTDRQFMEWVESLEPELSNRMKNWMKTNDKSFVGQFLLPIEMCQKGVPKEFVNAINVRGIVTELMGGFYIFLEMMGFYFKNKNNTRLISDEVIYRPEAGSFLYEE